MNIYLASLGPALANHLWQSTAFMAVAWLLAVLLRRSPARVRHTIWLAASVKFLVPFSLLIAAGNLLPHSRQVVAPVVYPAMDAIEEPFAVGDEQVEQKMTHTPTLREHAEAVLPESLAVLWALGAAIVLLVWMWQGRAVQRTRSNAKPAQHGRELEILQRVEGRFVSMRRRARLPLRLSSQRTEPGIFGVFLPVLVWPQALSARLDDEHIEAIMAHELMHVRRRDNLTAALHMLVEALFWFHPLVWWMERRLVKEREQACDEAVVEEGGDAETYAESLLKTCRFCVESPLPCVVGVTGGELKERVHSILTFRPNQLGRAARIILLTVSLGTVATPLALGLVHRLPVFGQILKATGPRPSYEVASIRLWRTTPPAPDTVRGEQVIHQAVAKFSPGNPGGQTTDRVRLILPLGVLIAQAYGLPEGSDGRANGRIVGGPDWMTRDSEQYEIQAKIDDQEFAAIQKMSPQQQREQVNLMNQSLLEERFKLKVHFETRELPAYALVVAKGGPKLTPAKQAGSTQLSSTRRGQTTELTATGASLAAFAGSPLLTAGTGSRTVIDQTGLSGRYDFTLKWSSELSPTGQPTDEPSLLTAIQEQLGLKLVPTKGPVEVIVIDHIERPTVDGAEVTPTSAIVVPAAPTYGQLLYRSGPLPSFEVATVKPMPNGPPPAPAPQGGSMVHLFFTPKMLVMYAYNLPDFSEGQITKGPGWMEETYDVQGKIGDADFAAMQKMPAAERQQQIQLMLQSLLKERFNLKVHLEKREQTIYALELAKTGPKLTAAQDEKPGRFDVTHNGQSYELNATGIDLDLLASLLSRQPEVGGRSTVNRTGLQGNYDVTLRWTRTGSAASDTGAPAAEVNAPSYFTAIQEQLGLRLVSTKGQVDDIVVDHIEKPSSN